MKILGAFSFMFGIGLLILAGYGFMQEIKYASFFGKIIICALLISGSCIILFVARTFSRNKISNVSLANEDILDIPEHVLEEERSNGLPPFILGCGYLSIIVSAVFLLYSGYLIFMELEMRSFLGGESSAFAVQLLILSLLFSGALMLLIYSIKKLFFSRK